MIAAPVGRRQGRTGPRRPGAPGGPRRRPASRYSPARSRPPPAPPPPPGPARRAPRPAGRRGPGRGRSRPCPSAPPVRRPTPCTPSRSPATCRAVRRRSPPGRCDPSNGPTRTAPTPSRWASPCANPSSGPGSPEPAPGPTTTAPSAAACRRRSSPAGGPSAGRSSSRRSTWAGGWRTGTWVWPYAPRNRPWRTVPTPSPHRCSPPCPGTASPPRRSRRATETGRCGPAAVPGPTTTNPASRCAGCAGRSPNFPPAGGRRLVAGGWWPASAGPARAPAAWPTP